MSNLYRRKEPPPPSLMLLTNPAGDRNYGHFEVWLADGSVASAVSALPFEVGAFRRFSSVNAWWLADAALLAYWDRDTARARFRDGAGLTGELVERDGTACYVASNGAFTIVAFRGTQPSEEANVWSDVDFVLTAWPNGGEVHEGFKHALDLIWDRLMDRLKDAPDGSIWFTGHSLGGALATLAADRLGKPAGVYTFGSPRVGNLDFVRGFNERYAGKDGRSFRYTNNHDVVVHVPPSAWRFGHVDIERHFNANGQISAMPAGSGLSVIREAAERFTSGVTAITSGASILPAGLIDHTPRRYATFAWNAFVEPGPAATP